jgi:hypothetical protein
MFMWKTLNPRKPADSSAGAEGVLATHAVKALISLRIVLAELHLLIPEPTPLFMDALGTMNGVKMEQVSNASRYMAVRLAMIRQAIMDGLADMNKVGTNSNIADICTKPLVGAKLEEMRAKAMGLDTRGQRSAETTASRGAAQMARDRQQGNEFSSDVTGDGPTKPPNGSGGGGPPRDDIPWTTEFEERIHRLANEIRSGQTTDSTENAAAAEIRAEVLQIMQESEPDPFQELSDDERTWPHG